MRKLPLYFLIKMKKENNVKDVMKMLMFYAKKVNYFKLLPTALSFYEAVVYSLFVGHIAVSNKT